MNTILLGRRRQWGLEYFRELLPPKLLENSVNWFSCTQDKASEPPDPCLGSFRHHGSLRVATKSELTGSLRLEHPITLYAGYQPTRYLHRSSMLLEQLSVIACAGNWMQQKKA